MQGEDYISGVADYLRRTLAFWTALGAAIGASATVEPTWAAEGSWSCRNQLEVLCDGETCSALGQGEFTPMSVRFDRLGHFAVCAYSGCWEGQGTLLQQDKLWLLSQPKASWTGAPGASPGHSRLAILFDRVDQMALLKVEAFQLPLRCVLEHGLQLGKTP